MTGALQRVSFRKPVVPLPRLSVPYQPGVRSDRFWSAAEKKIVKKYYPKGGVHACLAHLAAHRTPSGVYGVARKLGLVTPHGKADYKGENGKVVAPKGFEQALREFYLNGDGKKRGECNAFADSLKLPRWWVSKQAIQLGLAMPHKKEPEWSNAELELLKSVPLHNIERCSKIFREHGFQRSATSIKVKAARSNLSRRYRETLSASSAARILGVDLKTIAREILQGDLEAEKRPTKRLPQQGGDPWSIKPEQLRLYILKHLERIDLRKVDKFAFVQVVAGEPLDSPKKARE